MAKGRIKRWYQIGKSVISIGLIVYQSAQEIIKLKNRISRARQSNTATKTNIKDK